MVFVFGLVLTAVNAAVFGSYFEKHWDSYDGDDCLGLRLFNLFVMAPVAAVMTLGPLFAPVYVLPSAQRVCRPICPSSS